MNKDEASTPRPARKRRWLLGLSIGFLVLLLLLALAVQQILQPRFATKLILREAGQALGLDITATGEPELQLRGTPRWVIRGVSAKLPGTQRELLRAERILLSLPWSTLKSRGQLLDIDRVELDAPVLDLAVLAEWRKSRPPTEQQRLPTLTRGLQVTKGQVLGNGWRVEGININLPRFAPEQPLHAQASGRYVARTLQLPFDLHLALSKPADNAALGLVGDITPTASDWKMPMRIRLSAPMHWGDDGLRLTPAKLGAKVRYEGRNGDPIPFAFGAYGPARVSTDGLHWPSLTLALRADGVVPNLDAVGAVEAGKELQLRLAGQIQAWPDAWPRLPKPLSDSRSPLPFTLDYVGAFDFSDVFALGVRRDATRFDGRLHVRDVLAWRDAASAGSPIPPIDGRLITPKLEIAGAQLEGVEVEIEAPSVPPTDTVP